MTTYKFYTPNGDKQFTSLEKAETFKMQCENKGLRLIATGGNIWDGWLFVYAE